VQSAIFGLSGFRPSQGALTSQGMARVVGRYDSVAWLVRDPTLHVKIAEAFKLPGECPPPRGTLADWSEVLNT